MLLINATTGIPEDISPEDIAKEDRKQSRRTSSFGIGQSKGPRRPSPIGETYGSLTPRRSNIDRLKHAEPIDTFVPEITRTSDSQKTLRKKTKSTFGAKNKSAQVADGITRTSDNPSRFRKSTYDRSQPRVKPNHSSKSYAVFLLSKREYSAANLRKKIVDRGYSEDEADDALSFVIAHKYQCDERYAGMKSRNIEMRSGNSKVLLTLKSKGIDEEIAIAQISDLLPESERAIAVAQKFKRLIGEFGPDLKLKAKIYRFLGSRGFSPRSIKDAMDSLVPGYMDDHFDPNNS